MFLVSHWPIILRHERSSRFLRILISGVASDSVCVFYRNPECFSLLLVLSVWIGNVIYIFICIIKVIDFYKVLGYSLARCDLE